MILSTELRIGNWVSVKGTDKFNTHDTKIVSIDRSEVRVTTGDDCGIACDFKDIEGILLTVEILQNFKFHEISNWIFILNRICLKQNLFGVGFYYFNEFNNYNKNPIIYVHELQNLFYCLTKKELTINNS